jgi:DNA-binding transcriptional LysR family regulator
VTDRLSGVGAFVAVVETGGFAAASDRLGLSRSAVGKTVARLEARLGTRLLHRTTRSIRLTEDGQAFYERCVRALAELDAAEAALESGRAEPVGRLKVSAPVLFGRRCVLPVLLALCRAYPRLEIEIAFSDRPVDLVDEGFDLAIRNGALPDNAGLKARRIASQRMTVCAAPDYVAARGRPASVEDISGHDAIVYARAGRARSWLFPGAGGRTREVLPPNRIRLDDLEAVADAAAAGMGLAWLPCWLIADRVRAGALETLLDDVPRITFDSHALWPLAPHMPSRVRVAIDALAARLPAMMG